MINLRIEKVSSNNIDELQKISRDTFFESFVTSTSEENMQHYLENNFSKEQLTKEIENNYSEFYFAILENEVIGYLKINYSAAQTELKDDHTLEVERVYVRNNFHGKSVGQQLLDMQYKSRNKKRCNQYGWGYGKTITEQSTFTRKMDLSLLIRMYLCLAKKHKPIT